METMTTRDPRNDPQPSDELRGMGQIWRVLKREDQRVMVSGPRTRCWIRVDRWQAWCEKNGMEAAAGKMPGEDTARTT